MRYDSVLITACGKCVYACVRACVPYAVYMRDACACVYACACDGS
jgi:hypothetical protein